MQAKIEHRKSPAAENIYYTQVCMHQNEEIRPFRADRPAVYVPGNGCALVRKLAANSGIYWDDLLNQIDFQPEIGHHWRPVGVIRTTRANYLKSLVFLGTGLD